MKTHDHADPNPSARRHRDVNGEADNTARRRASRLMRALAHAYLTSAPFYLHSLAVGPVIGTADREARP